MFKQIIKQIWAQRKINAWLLLELLVVSIAMWYVIVPIFVINATRAIPSGFDYNKVYAIGLGSLPANSLEHREDEATPENMVSNFDRIFNQIKVLPEVEYITCAFNSLYPYGPSMHAFSYQSKDSTNVSIKHFNFVPGDFFKVFRYNSFYGVEREILDESSANEDAIFITRDMEKLLFGEELMTGKYMDGLSGKSYQINGVLDYVKLDKSGQPEPICFYPLRVSAELLPYNVEIFIRLKEGVSENRFIDSFREDIVGKLRYGNLYVNRIISGNKLEKNYDYENGAVNKIRVQTGLAFFLIFNMILGIMGTFWLRSESRREEIGIRMAMGSNRWMIKKQFLMEGVILVTLASVTGFIFLLHYVWRYGIEVPEKNEFAGWYLVNNTTLIFLIVFFITYVVMLLTVLIAIWFPANKASNTDPVCALRDE